MEFPVARIKKGNMVLGRNDKVKRNRLYEPSEPNLEDMTVPKATLKGGPSKNEKLKVETEEVPTPEAVSPEPKQVSNPVTVDVPEDITDNDIIMAIKLNAYFNNGSLPMSIVANKFTGIIRYMYIHYLKDQGNSFVVDDLRYLDSIIFNIVNDLIECLFMYGYDEYIEFLIIDTIISQSNLMDYTFDDEFYTKIKDILKRIV